MAGGDDAFPGQGIEATPEDGRPAQPLRSDPAVTRDPDSDVQLGQGRRADRDQRLEELFRSQSSWTLLSWAGCMVKEEDGNAMYPFERFTEQAKRTLTLAQAEAETAHQSYIGTEHLLIALTANTDGLAHQVLTNLGLEVGTVRESISRVLGRNERIVIQQIVPTSRVKKIIEIERRPSVWST